MSLKGGWAMGLDGLLIKTTPHLIRRYALHFPDKVLPERLTKEQIKSLHGQLDFLDEKKGKEIRFNDITTKDLRVGCFVSNGSIAGEISRIHANGQFSIKGIKKVFSPLAFKKRDSK